MVIFANMKLKAMIQKGLLLLCMAPCLVFGQGSISGVVLDSRSGEPLPFATVYLNGTTKGTITDNDGRFELNGTEFPSTLVFSFVGYKTQILELDHNSGALQIRLSTNDDLPEVVITDFSEREKYLEYFKSMFLGDDRWGRRAIIRNDDVIMFDYHETDETGSVFKAWAGEPIIIDLPLLGYELYTDLVDFTIRRSDGKTVCDILGYFLYKPYGDPDAHKAAKFEKNRASAYYNSNRHFLKSFYENRLAENGYILSMPDTGAVDKTFKIRYYHKIDGSPLDLTKYKPALHLFSESGIHLLNDTCTILSNGTITDSSIRFIGDISEKRIGASLPEDWGF